MIWMRMEKDFMKKHYISLMRNEKDGNDIFALYMTMLTESIDHEGELRSADGVPFTNQTLLLLAFRDCIRPETAAKDMKRYAEVVEKSIPLFERLGLLEIDKEGTIHMLKLAEKIGSTSTERSRKHREKKKQETASMQRVATLHATPGSVASATVSNEKRNEVTSQNLESKLESEIDKEKRVKEKTEGPAPSFYTPTYEEVWAHIRYAKYSFKDKDTGEEKREAYTMDPQRFFSYNEAHGWLTSGGKPITNWKGAINAWEAKERIYAKEKKKSSKPDIEVPWMEDYLATLKDE